jgi:hypothetical protein
MIQHVSSNRCLDLDVDNQKLYVSRCSTSSKGQQWTLQYLDEEALVKWDQL